MNLIKYFFLAPINPVKEWVNFNRDLKSSNSVKDELMALLLLYLMTVLGYSYLKSLLFEEALFSLESSIELYLRSIVQIGIVIFAFNINKKKVGFNASTMEIGIYAVICFGLPSLLWSVVKIYWSPYDFFYTYLGFSFFSNLIVSIVSHLPPLLLAGILFTIAMTKSERSNIYQKNLSDELGFVTTVTLFLVGFNLVFNYLYSIIWSAFYMF